MRSCESTARPNTVEVRGLVRKKSRMCFGLSREKSMPPLGNWSARKRPIHCRRDTSVMGANPQTSLAYAQNRRSSVSMCADTFTSGAHRPIPARIVSRWFNAERAVTSPRWTRPAHLQSARCSLTKRRTADSVTSRRPLSGAAQAMKCSRALRYALTTNGR